MNDSKNGHRMRLRGKFMENPAFLNETELLELILTYSIPRKDVKPLATELIINFGSLPSVLAADADVLCQTKGINEYAAACLKIVAWVGKNYSNGQNIPSDQAAIKDFLPADIAKQATKPVEAPSYKSLGSLFTEEGANILEDKPKIENISKKPVRSGSNMFIKSLLGEAIKILPYIPHTDSMEEIRVFLNNNLHYNSEKTRVRYANYITRRLFPPGHVVLPFMLFSRKYAGMQELRDVCFYRFCKAEPLMPDIIQNLLIPEYRSGSVTRSDLRAYLKNKYPQKKSFEDCAQAIVDTLVAAGIAKSDRTKITYAYRDILLPSLAFILHSEFPRGMHYLNEVEDCAAFQYLFWRQNQIKDSLYALRNMNIVPKISEIDNVRQITITLDLEQVVERLVGRSPS